MACIYTPLFNLLFEKDGTPRLPKVASSIASASLAIALINIYIQQIVGILSIIFWCGSISWLYFYTTNRMRLLRVDLFCEILGLDACYLGALRPWVREIIHS